MEPSVKEFMEQLLEHLHSIDYIKSEDIPNIDLYMDQITTFMDSQLEACKRYEDDKILTKTMINNYAKNNLLPPPEKKRYSKEHVLTLLFIYYFKSILSISDIQSILNPITDRYFGGKDGLDMQDIYNEIFNHERAESEKMLKDIGKKYALSSTMFEDFPEEDQKLLHTFSFICLLSFDVYVKKMIVESVIDDLNKEMKAASDAEAEAKAEEEAKQTEAKKAEDQAKKADAEAKKAEAEVKKAEAAAKKAEAKKAIDEAKKAEAEAKAAVEKAK